MSAGFLCEGVLSREVCVLGCRRVCRVWSLRRVGCRCVCRVWARQGSM